MVAVRLLTPILALLTACAVGAALLGEPVSLRPGESATVDELTLTFERIDGDNRCPRDVNCFVGGKATVVLGVEGGEDKPRTLRINVPPGNPGRASYRGYAIEADVAPEPIAGKRIEAEDYVVTLVVTRE